MSERRCYPRIPLCWPGIHFPGRPLTPSAIMFWVGLSMSRSRGIAVDLATRIPVGSLVKVRAYGLNFDGCATIRRVSSRIAGYVLGLEVSESLDTAVLAEISAPQSEAVPPTLSPTAFVQ